MSNIPPPPPPGPPPGYIPYTYGQGYARPARTNGMGITSMVLGIVDVVVPCFWIFPLPGVLAVVFGFVSLSQFRNRPTEFRGKGMAIAGLVCGIVGLVIFVLWVAFGDWSFGVNS